MNNATIEGIMQNLHTNGYTFPVDIIEEHRVDRYLSSYYDFLEKLSFSSLEYEHKFKAHLLFKWVNEVIRDETILNIARSYLGENILCWNSIFFYKPKMTKLFVGWHEDKTYWHLENDNIITFSIALTESDTDNGCMKFLKKGKRVEYRTRTPKYNMLARGQDAILDGNEEFENVCLMKGQCSIFKQDVIHGSDQNFSNRDRFLLAIRYITPDNLTSLNHKSATLVSGIDNYNYYEKEPVPVRDFDKKCVKYHQTLMAKQAVIYGKDKLKQYRVAFLAELLRNQAVRGLYYKLNK